MKRIAVIIPAYNAAGTIGPLIMGLKTFVPPENICVVNDGSSDQTGSIARESGVTCLDHARNEGKGRALSTGFRFARDRRDVEAVITMDADLQHDFNDLPGFVSKRRDEGFNIVLGWRKRQGTGMPISRRASNTITSYLVSLRTGISIPDSQCGYRLIGMEVVEALSLESSGYEAETELLIKASKKGFTIGSIPIRTVYAGERSHMTYWQTTKRFVQTLMKEY